MNYRDALYYAMTGDSFDGKQAKQMGFVNFSYPKERLREETIKLAKKLMEKSPATLRYTKEAIRAVRFMNEPQRRIIFKCQERCVALQRQGEQPRGRHEAVPGREELPSRLRPLQAQAGQRVVSCRLGITRTRLVHPV